MVKKQKYQPLSGDESIPKLNIRNKDDTKWINILNTENIELKNTKEYFKAEYLEDALIELFERFVVIGTNQESTTVYKGQPVCITSNNELHLADASDDNLYNPVGFIFADEAEPNADVSIKTDGTFVATIDQWNYVLEDETNGLVEGETYYLSDVTPGKITKNSPDQQGHYLVPLGQALTQTHFRINFDHIIGL